MTGPVHRTVLFRSILKSGTERGSVHTGTEKNQVDRPKTGPETETIRYRSVPFLSEQKNRSSLGPTCLVSTGDAKLVSMTTSNVEVEI